MIASFFQRMVLQTYFLRISVYDEKKKTFTEEKKIQVDGMIEFGRAENQSIDRLVALVWDEGTEKILLDDTSQTISRNQGMFYLEGKRLRILNTGTSNIPIYDESGRQLTQVEPEKFSEVEPGQIINFGRPVMQNRAYMFKIEIQRY